MNSPDAWDDGRVQLSTGYISDVDLYREKLSITLGDLTKMEMKRRIERREMKRRMRGKEMGDDDSDNDGGYGDYEDDHHDGDEDEFSRVGLFNKLIFRAAMMITGQIQLNSSNHSNRNDDTDSSSDNSIQSTYHNDDDGDDVSKSILHTPTNIESICNTPLFRSGNPVIDIGSVKDGLISAKYGFSSLQDGFMSVIQEPGDLILIPPGCWHQVICR